MCEKNSKTPSMTALMSCFIKAYHEINGHIKIFNDHISKELLSSHEYAQIAQSLSNGISFFNPTFSGTSEDALDYIICTHLGPSVLGRSAFAEQAAQTAQILGINQYIIFASGYDTFGCRHPNLKVFDLDKEEMLSDKLQRINRCNISSNNVTYFESDFTNSLWTDNLLATGFNPKERTFCTLLGISYYLTSDEFGGFIKDISSILSPGSTIVFDYPTVSDNCAVKFKEKLAQGAGEKMVSQYSYQTIEKVLEDVNMLIYEHLESQEIYSQFFTKYNTTTQRFPFIVPKDVAYCLAVI